MWDSAGVKAIKELIILYHQKDPYLFIKNNDYPVYTDNGVELHNHKNKIFTFDKKRFERSLLNEDDEKFLESLIIPTKEGLYIDCHSLDCNFSNFYKGLPIIMNSLYETKQNRCTGNLNFILNFGRRLKLKLVDISGKSLGY